MSRQVPLRVGLGFAVSLLVTVACALAGYPIAYYVVYYSGRHRTVILVGLLAPLFISALVRTYGWVILLGQGGPVDSALASLGLIRGPLRIIGSESGVALPDSLRRIGPAAYEKG